MGRAGVTFLDVEKAALQLQGRGKLPTVDGIREILGTGSKSTIAQHLRTWRTRQPNNLGTLPQDLLALVTGLWERLSLQAEQRIIETENTHEQRLQELKTANSSVHQDLAHLQKQFHQREEDLSLERAVRQTLEKQFQQAQQEYIKLLERHQVTSQQMENYKAENERLHQLASNIQANLEHYQIAMQQQRSELMLAMEKQQTQLQQEITEIKRELALKNAQSKELEQQLSQTILESQQLQSQYHTVQRDYTYLSNQFQECTRELIVTKERSEQQQQTLESQKREIDEKSLKITEFEKQNAILQDQRDRLQKNLSALEDKVEVLRQDKLFLAQEKSQLEGYLKKSSLIEAYEEN